MPETSDFEKLWFAEDGDNWLLRGFSNFRTPLAARRPTEVLTNVYSFDDTFLLFLRELSKQLNEHPALKPGVDDNQMVGENGIHTGFDRLRTVAGFAMSPLSWVPVDNHKLMKEFDLPFGFRSERHKSIFTNVFKLVFSSWEPDGIKVPKHSTVGIPMLGNYDPEYKRKAALWLFSNVEKILVLVDKGDYITLAREYGIVFCFNLNRRGQVDDPGKVRTVFDFEYAMSGGRSGKPLAADKHVIFNDGREYPDFSAMRERIVQGASWMVNSILQVIASGHMNALFTRFPETFHHTDPQVIADAAAEAGDATFSDVSDYDRSIGSHILDLMFDVMREYWDPRLVKMYEVLYHAPYYARPLSAGSHEGNGFVGLPLDPERYPINAGNRSGHAGTSLTAKIVKVADSLCVIDDVTGDVLGNEERYLKWQMPIKLVNNGDDEGAIGSPTLIQAYRVYRYDNKHGYLKVAPEVGQGFSGTLIRWKGQPVALPRLHTIFEKMYVPERSIGTRFRKRWPIGILARLNAFDKHPVGHYAAEIHRKLWHDMMSPTYGDLYDIIQDGNESMDIRPDGHSAIDTEVLEDESKVHYKYRDSDVSPDILALIVKKISAEETLWAHSYYNGHII